jgi:hypothetical protein
VAHLPIAVNAHDHSSVVGIHAIDFVVVPESYLRPRYGAMPCGTSSQREDDVLRRAKSLVLLQTAFSVHAPPSRLW